MEFKEKTLEKNYLYKGKILNFRRDTALLPNGSTAIREMVEHDGGSCVLCIEDGKVLLVKQFRYPHGQELWEIPAGKVNKGESPEQTAIRELEEECGIKAEKMEKLFEVYPTTAYTNEVIHIYRATGLTNVKAHLDEDEFLSAQWIDIEQVKLMMDSGEIKDGKTLIALLKTL